MNLEERALKKRRNLRIVRWQRREWLEGEARDTNTQNRSGTSGSKRRELFTLNHTEWILLAFQSLLKVAVNSIT